MCDNSLISLIVPIYNVDKYLSNCIESIINQSYKNLEIILIDDGSTDNSGSICDYYKNKDSRIIVVHKNNGGLSSTRNKGIDIAKGDLICFIDSDDYLEPTMLEDLKNNMDKYDSDISCCNFYDVKNNNSAIRVKKDINIEFVSSDKDKFINMQNEYSALTYYAWNKLYKKSLFDNIRFPSGRLYEYTYILCDIFDRAHSISFTLKPLYNYVYRSSSLGNSFNIKHFDKIGSFNKKIEFFINKGYTDLSIEEMDRKASSIISNLAKLRLYGISNHELFTKYYDDLVNTVSNLNFCSSSRKVKMFKLFKHYYISLCFYEYKFYNFFKKIKS